jgi:V8-like Glu-specific endopeptidase
MNKNQPTLKKIVSIGVASVLGCAMSTGAFAAQAGVTQLGNVTAYTPSDVESQAGGGIDYVNAKPMELPVAPAGTDVAAQQDLINALTGQQSQSFPGAPGVSPGAPGNGKTSPINLGAPAPASSSDDVASQEFGTNNHPFSTAKADLSVATNTTYPYRASGKLFFKDGTSSYVCSASLIKKGIVVTAAHCVSKFKENRFYTGFQFAPGYRNGSAPYGTWTATRVYAPTSYLNGSASCSTAGVVCVNDVAVIVLAPKTNTSGVQYYAGQNTGWYGYGYNGWGFTSGGLTHITQIGYPVCLNNGAYMERNDSQGFKSSSSANNTIIGSLMCGGSSGGPWLANFGYRPALTGTSNGSYYSPNVVVGVTSWGYTSTSPKQQGASPFTSTNIVPLVNSACTAYPSRC